MVDVKVVYLVAMLVDLKVVSMVVLMAMQKVDLTVDLKEI